MTTDIAQLVVRLAGQVVQTLPLVDSLITIGRTPDNQLSLPHPLVARQHAELRVGEAGSTLTDLGSASGTFVGNLRLLPHQPHLLAEQARIRIGPFEIVYEGPGAAEESAFATDRPARSTVELATALPPPVALEPPRETYRPPPPVGPRSRYLADLPAIFHDGDFLGRYLQIFEAIWEPLEQRQDHIAMYFDPATCPAAVLPLLSSWLDLYFDRTRQESRQRALLAEAMELYRWRGTRYGLTRMIELSIGITPEVLDEPGQPFVMRVRVRDSAEHPVDRRLLEEMVQAHKPAHIGYVLEIIGAA
jgi:phage tail-like protein